MSKKRLRALDIAKGIAIILVVIGHAVPDATTHMGIQSEGLAILNRLIYSFHMPLFFLISGYFVNTLAENQSRVSAIWKKFQRLMVPYIFVGLCYAPCKLLLSRFANDPFHLSNLWKMVIGVNPDGELWFLYSLFVISVFAYLVKAKVGKAWIVCSGIIGGGTQWLPVLPGNILFFQFFFFLGMYIKQHDAEWFRKISWKSFTVLLVLWGALNVLMCHGMVPSAKLFTGIFGSFCTLRLAVWLEKSDTWLVKALEVAGLYCMEIYILSDIIKIPIRIILWSKLQMYYTAFFACSIVDTILPIWIKKYIISRWSLLNYLCFGEK